MVEIFSNIERKCPEFLSNCTVCKKRTFHERTERLLMLPDVLIVNLERFQRTRLNRTTNKNCNIIEPSIILPIGETMYSLNAVVTHYGTHAHKGHYIATLYKNGHWIDCNDQRSTEDDFFGRSRRRRRRWKKFGSQSPS